MRKLDMDTMMREIDEGKGPKQASETKPFMDKHRMPMESDMDDMDKKRKKMPMEKPTKMPKMKSNMPVGARMRGAWGDVGALRGKEAIAAGGFRQGRTMDTRRHFMKGR